jgi:hypothetical protein
MPECDSRVQGKESNGATTMNQRSTSTRGSPSARADARRSSSLPAGHHGVDVVTGIPFAGLPVRGM